MDAVGGIYEKLTAKLRTESGLLSFTTTVLAIALALGFIGGAFAGLVLMTFLSAPNSLHYGLVAVFAFIVFAAVWCSEDGPPRWRPIVIADDRLKNMSTTTVSVLIAFGAVALVAAARIGRL
jgi:hypothetical protein